MLALERKNIYSGALLLINADHPLREDDNKSLAPADMRYPEILMKRNAANVLQFILKKISAESAIVPVSGYRSSEEQTAIYKDSLRENGAEFTRKYVALPDHSEHQSGLAIDLGLNKEEIDFICPDFPYEGICEEFRQTAPDYGFIERYEEEKEQITGISHEPWHFRYVGFPHSRIMKEHHLSLEEYTEFIKDFREDHRFCYKQGNGNQAEIFYVPAEDEKMLVAVPETSVYQVSGNNVDGFIVTVWR